MKLEAVQCPACMDVILPRYEHDLHCCTCGAIAVDRSGDRLRVLYDRQKPLRCLVIIEKHDLLSGSGIFSCAFVIEPEATYLTKGRAIHEEIR